MNQSKRSSFFCASVLKLIITFNDSENKWRQSIPAEVPPASTNFNIYFFKPNRSRISFLCSSVPLVFATALSWLFFLGQVFLIASYSEMSSEDICKVVAEGAIITLANQSNKKTQTNAKIGKIYDIYFYSHFAVGVLFIQNDDVSQIWDIVFSLQECDEQSHNIQVIIY